jgi:putative GTP pyrophosphokinase
MALKKTTRADNVPGYKPAAALEIDEVWQSNSQIIRRFLGQQSDFQQLCSEVEYTLTKLLRKANVKIAAVTSRAKTLESFLEKIQRKSYGNPFAEITDLAGVRVVCLFPDDLPVIGKLISNEFTIVEGPGTRAADDIERFGYSADHYIVVLGKNTAGARYDDLKERVCEIQVRTVLQDAWAILSHHLLYKQERQIPRELQRWILSLAGALESADFMYEVIRDRRNAYITKISESAHDERVDRLATNLDSLSEYLRRKFPKYELELYPGFLSEMVREYNVVTEYPTLRDVDDLLNRTAKARAFCQKETGEPEKDQFATSQLFQALVLVHEPGWDRMLETEANYEKARPLVEKSDKA